MSSTYNQYFEDWEVKPEFNKEFISLWFGWLGEENLHKLDEVTEHEWSRFNELIRLVAKKYEIEIVDCESETTSGVSDIEGTLSTYDESMNKDSPSFSKYVLPQLGCIISEEWDYAYILWHKDNGAVEALAPIIKKAGLKHFHD